MDQLTAEDPARIGPYRLIARLGAGGMGLVYLGRSEGGRTVAVKVVQAEYAGNAEFRRRFAREVAAARRVGGSWTADVLDADPEAAVPWVATQYIPGPDLHSVVAEDFGPLPEHSVRALANRLALALQAVHEAGLIHRDLKPSNVLVTVDGPRVIDFGIARAMDSLTGDSLHTHTGMLIGSPGFMSPEQVRGLELTPASDVFCLGAVLVYAATGRMLFGATDTGLNAHLFRVAEEEADLTGVPDSLVGLVRACLEKDPARRPAPREIAQATVPDDRAEWLPGSVLAQLGRHAARLLDFAPPVQDAPPAVPAQADPRIALAWQQAQQVPPPPGHAPTAPAHGAPGQGFGPPVGQAAVAGAVWAGATAPAHAVHDSAAPNPRRWWGLGVAVLAQLLVLMQGSVLNHVLPAVQADLGLGLDQMNWTYLAHALAFAALTLFGGHLSDLVGRRRTLVVGVAVGIVAAVLAGAAPVPGVLITASFLQGVCAALITPAALSLVARSFTDPRERRTAFGLFTGVVGGGAALGMLAGGTLTELLSWRVAFYAAVPFAVVVLIGTLTLVSEPATPSGTRFDPAGVVLSSLGLGALVYGLGRIGEQSWTAPATLVPCAAGLLLTVGFLWSQSRAASPLLPVHTLRDPRRAGSLVVLGLLGVGTFGLYAAVAFRLRYVLGQAPVMVGLSALPLAVAALLAATLIAARLSSPTAPRILVVTGAALTGAGLVVLALAPLHAGYLLVLPALLLIGSGSGLAFPPLYDLATGAPAEQPSVGTGGSAAAVAVVGQLGGAIGAAVFATVMTSGTGVGTSGGGGLNRLFDAYAASLWWGAGAALLAALVGGLAVTAPRVTPGAESRVG
ncbi:bifunctional serine/threonine protein kinase/MFS transporter [Streptomyces sp. NPDC053431]|uniref:bifunctional serine/threonine protein kinase/MFS transporter n=1 Tax=Streptomyces sp. NPDC053431 TaxID=3365703 RepID=UPI0037D8E143